MPYHRIVSVILASACAAAVPAFADPLTAVVDSPSNIQIKLGQVANIGLTPIDASTIPGNSNLYVGTYVASTAEIVVVNPVTDSVSATPFLDFSNTSVPITGQGLQGLTFSPNYNDPNSPGYHKLYTYEEESSSSPSNVMYLHPEVPNPADVGVIREWTANAAGTAINTSVASRVVFNFGTPAGHMGGGMKFGPDGLLYLSTGDGGGNGDGNSTTSSTDGFTGRDVTGTANDVPGISNAQDFTNALGKVLRIDPYVTNGNGTARAVPANEVAKTFNGSTTYFIPESNPFFNDPQNIYFAANGVGNTPLPPMQELYAFGFRNPWKLSFDKNAVAGDSPYIASPGSHERESIVLAKPGQDYGWPYREGDITAPAATNNGIRPNPLPFLKKVGNTYVPYDLDPTLTDPAQMATPIAVLGTRSGTGSLEFVDRPGSDLDNDGIYGPSYGDANAVVGGFVYRGTLIPQLYGKYVFGAYQYLIHNPADPGDAYAAISNGGRLFYFDPNENATYKTVDEFNFDLGGGISNSFISGSTNNTGDLMGVVQGDNGELYAMFINGDIKEILPSAVPEPGTLALLGLGAVLLRKRRR